MQYLVVFLGGGLGAASRHLVNVLAARMFGLAYPWGTIIVNVAGSLAMGALIGWWASRSGMNTQWRLFAATGFLGGFTTFSAFSLDFAGMWERGAVGPALLYAATSVVLAIAALFAGLALGRS